ncbi:MAG TPA: glycosyltransferase family 9 protein [Gemmatimonadota bacterium]|nr:glycosyltransferase family 9 protein [Gemmatimonadota bacterium]
MTPPAPVVTPPASVVMPPAGVRPADPAFFEALVLRVPNWIGDAVLALPAVTALVEAFRDRTIVAVARPVVAPLFAGQAGIDEVVRMTDRGAGRFARARRGIAAALRGSAPAVGVVFPHSLSAAGELAAAGVQAVWGYGGWARRLALDVALPRRWVAGRHRWEEYALLAAAVTGRPAAERYTLATGAGDRTAADRLFAEDPTGGRGPRVGIVPGAHASSRRWPVARFTEIAGRLGRDGMRVILFGSAADRERTAAIAAAADPPPLDWAGRTPLPVLVECFRRLDFLLTNDTGPMHLAAAVGTPLLDLCGAADERVTGPRGPASEVMVHPIHCRPCVKNSCAYNLGCMTGIPVESVYRHIRSRLEMV